MMEDDLDDFDDNDPEIDQELDGLEKEIGLKKTGDAAKKPRIWRSVEQYVEDRRLRDALSEFEYDL
ncbi:MAG: hypothetical protein OQK99_09645 [Gammaproteobacteria bacterium]|nr:hypothetical protein [Gammaproteobacteria bacterium]